MTLQFQNLNVASEYDCSEQLYIGDGSSLDITHTGSTLFHLPSKTFTLHDVLCVPKFARNLIFVSQFCNSNCVSIEFFSDLFEVKELDTGKILARDRSKDGVYQLTTSEPILKPNVLVIVGIKTNIQTFHYRLGHLSSLVLQHVIKVASLPCFSSVFDKLCNAYACSKVHKLPFSESTLRSSKPLELIYTDVWVLLMLHL